MGFTQGVSYRLQSSVTLSVRLIGPEELPVNKYSAPKSLEGKTTHCLRHSFRDRLRDCDVPLEAIDQAGGWSSVGGVGTNYGKGYSLPKLAEYLRRIAI